MVLLTNSDVAAGSPGPLDKKTPSGFNSDILLKFVSAGTIVNLVFKFEKFLKIFFLHPKSKTTT